VDLEKEAQIRSLRKNERLPFELLLLADEALEAIEKYIHNADVYVLYLEGDEIAVYVLQEINNDCIEIKNLAVDEWYQRRGVGKFLLRDACKRAKRAGYKEIIIGTGNGSFGQLKLYQMEGFEMFDIKENFFLKHYPLPIFENGIQLKHMLLLKKQLC